MRNEYNYKPIKRPDYAQQDQRAKTPESPLPLDECINQTSDHPSTALEEIEKRITSINNGLGSAYERLEKINARLYGSVPRQDSEGEENVKPQPGMIYSISRRLDLTDALIDRLHNELSQTEQL